MAGGRERARGSPQRYGQRVRARTWPYLTQRTVSVAERIRACCRELVQAQAHPAGDFGTTRRSRSRCRHRKRPNAT